MSERDAVGYEQSDLNTRAIMWSAVGLAVTLLVIFVAIGIFHSGLSRHGEAARTSSPQTEPPLPRLQTNPAADLATLRAAEEAELHSYGRVDRKAGVVRIPIERAIELTVERGLPARPATKGATP